MNRVDLQQLAESRLLDATVLFDAGRFDGAYYLLGYVVECALKACITKQFGLHEVPDRDLIRDFYSHDLKNLLKVAGLNGDFGDRARTDPKFETNWTTVRDWREIVRYKVGLGERDVRSMLEAVGDQDSGILPWLRTQW
jgi:HEPN domain-containing protein